MLCRHQLPYILDDDDDDDPLEIREWQRNFIEKHSFNSLALNVCDVNASIAITAIREWFRVGTGTLCS